MKNSSLLATLPGLALILTACAAGTAAGSVDEVGAEVFRDAMAAAAGKGKINAKVQELMEKMRNDPELLKKMQAEAADTADDAAQHSGDTIALTDESLCEVPPPHRNCRAIFDLGYVG
jgi:hypothetical protein